MMHWLKMYRGGHCKRDTDTEFGPQYHGPKPSYGIRRGKSVDNVPWGGEGRTIPKLGGGPYYVRKQAMKMLTTNVLKYGKVETTWCRAKAVQYFVDRMILLAKRGDDLSLREAMEWMFDEKLVNNLFKQAPSRYPGNEGGYTKVTQTMWRRKTHAKMAFVELT